MSFSSEGATVVVEKPVIGMRASLGTRRGVGPPDWAGGLKSGGTG